MEIQTVADLGKLGDALSAATFSDADIGNILGDNWIRFVTPNLKGLVPYWRSFAKAAIWPPGNHAYAENGATSSIHECSAEKGIPIQWQSHSIGQSANRGSSPGCLITGASRGLGLAMARALAARGWGLVIDAEGTCIRDRACRACRQYSRDRIAGDVSDPAHRAALADAARALAAWTSWSITPALWVCRPSRDCLISQRTLWNASIA